MMPLDPELLAEIDAGYVRASRHPTEPITIYNYTPHAQFDWHWTNWTKKCRGLILHDDGHVVARPFEKFFGIEQITEPLPVEPFEVYEKLDGSLGILYFIGEEPFIATRGSFDGEQAERATLIFAKKYSHLTLDRSLTYLFEIIFPENRIVVDYGDTEDLFLLTTIHTESGVERGLVDVGFPIVKRYDGIADVAELKRLEEKNREGFVIRFRSGLRVKVKFAEYTRLHKLLTGINPRHIWEWLRDGKETDELIDRVPDEFMRWVRTIEQGLRQQFAAIEQECRRDFKTLPTRKETAAYFLTCTYPSILFSMLDGKDYAPTIWKLLYPAASAAFKRDEL
jgi:RNA ligase